MSAPKKPIGRVRVIGEEPPAPPPIPMSGQVPPSDDEIFGRMKRRAPVAEAPSAPAQRIRREAPPQVPVRWVVASLFRWIVAILRWSVPELVDRLRGRSDPHAAAIRVRDALVRMGEMGPKIGKQLAMRIDLMPLEHSIVLAGLKDFRPPMEFDVALERVREAVGCPLHEVFEIIDPEPIFSTTVSCIYQARLLSGRAVAVKVRRNDIRARLLAELKALGLLMGFLEMLTLVRPGFFEQLRAELMDLAHEEMDFSHQARSQTLFRLRVKRDRVNWLGAPRVHRKLSNGAVMVSEFVAGVRLSEVIDAVESQDHAALERLAKLNIQPEQVSRRLLQAAWWGLFENLFFIAQPTPENIVVQPGNKLVFLDFDDCGTLAANRKRLFKLALSRMAADDASGAAQAMVQMCCPLPFIDVYDFTKRIESDLWQQLYALRDKYAQWWERTSIGMWRSVLLAARDDGVTLRLELLAAMRSSLSYDTMAVRLAPDLDLLREFRRYGVRADRRVARGFTRDLARQDIGDLQAGLISRVARVGEGLARLGLWVETTVENLPVSNLALSGKAAYAFSQVLRFVAIAVVYTAFATAMGVIRTWGQLARPSVWDSILAALTSPISGVIFFFFFAVMLRRVLFRLDDKGDS